jgi:hypothetical protein
MLVKGVSTHDLSLAGSLSLSCLSPSLSLSLSLSTQTHLPPRSLAHVCVRALTLSASKSRRVDRKCLRIKGCFSLLYQFVKACASAQDMIVASNGLETGDVNGSPLDMSLVRVRA